MKYLGLIILFFILGVTYGQSDSMAKIIKTEEKYKWPYFHNPPPYIAISVGYEGLKTNNFQIGLAFNLFNIVSRVGGMAGGGIYFKRRTYLNPVYSYEAEIGVYGGIVLGLNYNYNVTTINTINGFKPFVGFAVYNCQFFYGYSFYNSKMDANKELQHNRITARLILPVLKLKKRQKSNYSR